MVERPSRGRLDLERIILVPVLTFFLILASARLLEGDPPDDASGLLLALSWAYRLLLPTFYLLAVVLLLVRTDPSAKSRGIMPRAIAYLGTFMPIALAFLPAPTATATIAVAGVALQTIGLGFTVYSLYVLGRSFGVEPQARALVQHGPYRVIRHPLYVGEIVSLLGAAMFEPSWARFGIVLAVGLLQFARTVYEERLLTESLSGYAEYSSRTSRFVPGLF